MSTPPTVQQFACYIQVSVDKGLVQEWSGSKICSRVGLQWRYGTEMPSTSDGTSLVLIIFILRISLQGVLYSFFFFFLFP